MYTPTETLLAAYCKPHLCAWSR